MASRADGKIEPGAPASEVKEPGGTKSWPERAELFIAKSPEGPLTLGAFGPSGLTPFRQVLASHSQATLYDAELELLWFGDADARLWVTDLRELGPGPSAPVLIASHLPEHMKLSVMHGRRYVEGPGRVGEEWMELVVHWEREPWIDGGEGEGRLDDLDGREWLERQLERPSRGVPAWMQFDAEGPHVALPPGIPECDDVRLCGSALPFGAIGWQLVVAKNDETQGDFAHNGCLLYDRAKQMFARPPEAVEWRPVVDAQLLTCGPYRFNARGDAFLVSDKACRVGGGCTSLDSYPSGWLEPGATVGME